MGSFWAAGEGPGAKALARVGLGLEQEREVPRCVTLISAFPGVGGGVGTMGGHPTRALG